MNSYTRLMLDQFRFWILAFIGIGAALGVGAFMVSIAFSGYASVFGPATIVSYLALWPYLLLHLVIPEHSLKSFFDEAPFAYLPGLPMLGWVFLESL